MASGRWKFQGGEFLACAELVGTLPPTKSHFVEQPIHTTSTSRVEACPHGALTRIPLVKCSPASLRSSDRVEVRPLCQERVASAAGVGDVSISRDSLRFAVRVAGHLDTCRQDGVHRSGRCGWAGTQFDCRARLRAGLRNTRAKGKRLGRPRVTVNRDRIGHVRAQGLSWAKIAAELGIGEGTVYRLAHASAKNLPS